ALTGVADGAFDVVLDKGTFDCIALGPDKVRAVRAALAELWRVLPATGGAVFTFSIVAPNERMAALSQVVALPVEPPAGTARAAASPPAPAAAAAAPPRTITFVVAHVAIDSAPYEQPDQQHTHLYVLTKPAAAAAK